MLARGASRGGKGRHGAALCASPQREKKLMVPTASCPGATARRSSGFRATPRNAFSGPDPLRCQTETPRATQGPRPPVPSTQGETPRSTAHDLLVRSVSDSDVRTRSGSCSPTPLRLARCPSSRRGGSRPSRPSRPRTLAPPTRESDRHRRSKAAAVDAPAGRGARRGSFRAHPKLLFDRQTSKQRRSHFAWVGASRALEEEQVALTALPSTDKELNGGAKGGAQPTRGRQSGRANRRQERRRGREGRRKASGGALRKAWRRTFCAQLWRVGTVKRCRRKK